MIDLSSCDDLHVGAGGGTRPASTAITVRLCLILLAIQA